MKLKGPHFAVAPGFSSASQQKSLPVPKALFSCLGLEVSDALFFIFWLSAVREVVLHFIASKESAAVVTARGLSRMCCPFLFCQAPVSSSLNLTGLFFSCYWSRKCVQKTVFAVYFLSFIFPCISPPALWH